MIVVADSTVLIYLAEIGKFNLLATLYGRILIPIAVYDEVVTQGLGVGEPLKPPLLNGFTDLPLPILMKQQTCRLFLAVVKAK